MNDNLKELLILNRMMVFAKLLSDNMVKPEIYVEKISTDLLFIGKQLELLFQTIFSNKIELKKYSKAYSSIFRKYYQFIDVLTENELFMNNTKFDYKTLMSYGRDVHDYTEEILRGGTSVKKNNTQYINENEYTMLLSQLEE